MAPLCVIVIIMSGWKNLVILCCIGIYMIFSVYLSINYLYPPAEVSGQQHVLGATTVRLPEDSSLPSLNNLLAKSNLKRYGTGQPLLTIDFELTKLAQSRADDMAQHGYFSHQNLEGFNYSHLLRGSIYEQTYSCENLALGSSLNTELYVNQWLNSNSGHKECLLNKSTSRVGYGVAKLAFDHSKEYDSESYIIVAIQAGSPN
jgi:uncharacterized protein YkwD